MKKHHLSEARGFSLLDQRQKNPFGNQTNFCLGLLGQVCMSALSFIIRPYFGTLFQQNYNVLKITKSLKGKLKVTGKIINSTP